MWKIMIVASGLIALAVLGIAVKMLLRRNGEFTTSCSSVDPATGKSRPCTCAGNDDEARCENRQTNVKTGEDEH